MFGCCAARSFDSLCCDVEPSRVVRRAPISLPPEKIRGQSEVRTSLCRSPFKVKFRQIRIKRVGNACGKSGLKTLLTLSFPQRTRDAKNHKITCFFPSFFDGLCSAAAAERSSGQRSMGQGSIRISIRRSLSSFNRVWNPS